MMNHYKVITCILLSIGYALNAGMPLKKNAIERPIVVVVCSYNNGQWSTNTLNSIFTQEYSNFRLIIVDDCSSDDNQIVIQKYIDDHNLGDRVTFIRNEKRYRKLFNLYRVLYDCDDDEIVFMVDGDDSLAHPRVFEQINRIYSDENVWFAYGQYRNEPASTAIQYGFKEMGYCRLVPKYIQNKQAYRYYSFVFMHPRSFRGWLFKQVKLEDLITDSIPGFEGDFYPAANDVAMYFPMVEMAHTHIKFIPDILYVRNLYSDIVGFKVDKRLQTASSREIRKKNCYPVLFQEKKYRLNNIKNAQTDLFLLCRYNLLGIENILENIQDHMTGFDTLYVFFNGTPENKKECRFIKRRFSNIVFIPYDDSENKGLKNRLLNTMSVSKNDHVVIMTDACSISEQIDLSDSIYWLERTYAYRFYLNRNALNKGVPRFIPLNNNICAWKLNAGPDKWRSTTIGEDAFMSRKATLYQEVKNLSFDTIYSFLKGMQSFSTLPSRVGLFFKNEKMKTAF
jgi:glycosyltransferase involved in cell wall biosynthesis